MALRVENTTDDEVAFELALHSYFELSDCRHVEISGLESVPFLDQLTGINETSAGKPIRFTGETDRIYEPSRESIVIHDPKKLRRIEVTRTNSNSTVVWNPWIAKAARMGDFGDEEWQRMCCVETANVRSHQVRLQPRESHTTTAIHRIVPL